MKRFDFPLEKVRLWRSEQADLEELKLQRLFGELNAIDAERQQAEADLKTAETQVRDVAVIDAQELANLDSYREFTRSRLQRIAEARRKCEARVNVQRQAVIEARRQFELLNRLKLKALAEWHASQDKEQEELAAELYLAKRRRDSSGSGL